MKKSFTLIELIVVIAIIAILATSGTLMLTKRFSSARDSSRKQSISQIGTALDVNMATQARFPTPENSSEVYDVSGALVWYQGTFGPSVADIITAIDSAPQDPNTNEYYGYSISYDKKQYQLKAELENEDTIAYLNQAYAANNDNKIAYVDGNYNGYILTYTGGKYYLYQLPSIFMKNEGLSAGSKIGSGTMEIINPGSKVSSNVQVKVADITTLVNGTDDGSTKTKVAQDLGVEEDLLDKVMKKSAGYDDSTSKATGGDTNPPKGGSFVINNGDADTYSANVILNITCPTDAEGSEQIKMAYGNTNNPNNWTDCVETVSHTLTSGEGTKTVYMKFKDSAGNASAAVQDDIEYLAAVAPSSLSLSHSTRSKTFTFSWTAGAGNDGTCKLQYLKDATTRTDIDANTYDCNADILGQSVTLPGDGWNGDWSAVDVQVRVVKSDDDTEVASFTQKLTCNTTSASTTATPSIDEDCDGNRDNSENSRIYCSSEHNTCSFDGTKHVRFGNLGQNKFKYKYNVNGSISCTTQVFGDPCYGYVKKCYYQGSAYN